MILNALRSKGIFDRRKAPRPSPAEELEKAVSELAEVTRELTAQLNHDPDWLRRTLIKKERVDGCDSGLVHDNNC